MNSTLTNLIAGIALVFVGNTIMQTHTADNWAAMGFFLLGWTILLFGSWKVGSAIGGAIDGKRR